MSEQQTTMRRKNKVNFTQVSNELLKDKRISWKAKGIMCYLLSLPEDWKFYMSELETHSTDGASSFRSGMKELKEFGYVERYPIKDESTKKVLYWETVLNEEAYKEDSVEIPQVEKPHVEIPQVENQTLQILSNTNTNKTNNKRPNFESSDMQLAELLYNYITKHNPNHKKPNFNSWANTFRLMRERDNRTHEQIEACIKWCQSDSFWYKNILSADKLREKYDQLRIQAGSKGSNKPTQQQVVSQPPQKKFDPSQLFAD